LRVEALSLYGKQFFDSKEIFALQSISHRESSGCGAQFFSSP